MEKNKILQLLIPALAGAALLALVLFIYLGPAEPKVDVTVEKGPDGKTKIVLMPESQRTTDYSFEKMSKEMPPLDSPQFRDIGGGLKIMDVEEGTGDPCPEGAFISTHYAGWLASNGTSFDSSYLGKNSPLSRSLSQLVSGWQQGFPGMKPGGIRRLIIPPELGYGNQRNGSIPGGSTLVFEVKLLSWK